MVVEEVAMQYGIAGVALAFFYLMFMAIVRTNAEAMAKLSDAIDNLNGSFKDLHGSFRDLREEIRLMRSEINKINGGRRDN